MKANNEAGMWLASGLLLLSQMLVLRAELDFKHSSRAIVRFRGLDLCLWYQPLHMQFNGLNGL